MKKMLSVMLLVSTIFTAVCSEQNPASAESTQKIGIKEWLIRTGKLAATIAARLDQELQQVGISSAEILKEFRKNPRKFLVQVPYHTRKRFIVLLPEHEKKITAAFIAHYEKNKEFYKDAKAQNRLTALAKKIVMVLPEKFPINIYLLKSEQVNAWCLPDGTVIITQAAVNSLDDRMLLALLAHEYGHAVCHHAAEKFTKMLMNTAGKVLLDAKLEEKLKNTNPELKVLIHAVYGIGSQWGFSLPYSRVMEYEADRLGVIFLHKAGFDPNFAVRLMELFSSETSPADKWTEFLNTHPMNAKRLERIKEEIKALNNSSNHR